MFCGEKSIIPKITKVKIATWAYKDWEVNSKRIIALREGKWGMGRGDRMVFGI